MSEFDIRNTPDEIKIVRFADPAGIGDIALSTSVIKGNKLLEKTSQKHYTHIGRVTWDDRYVVAITNKETAQNLIKALQWAVDNNWFGE